MKGLKYDVSESLKKKNSKLVVISSVWAKAWKIKKNLTKNKTNKIILTKCELNKKLWAETHFFLREHFSGDIKRPENRLICSLIHLYTLSTNN